MYGKTDENYKKPNSEEQICHFRFIGSNHVLLPPKHKFIYYIYYTIIPICSWILTKCYMLSHRLIMRLTVFWDMMPCWLVDRYQCFRGTCCPASGFEGGGLRFLGNVGFYLLDYIEFHPIKRPQS
jgi:hypothetical protein